jgi:hypothetical protein
MKTLLKNENCAEASTNGAKHKFDSPAELVCELRQICVFHSWWAFCLLFSHKKVRKRFKVNEDFVAEPLTFEFGFLP